uniref:UDP-galactose translocator n=1 Tax=Macrostomum lignano TaxID=282301 RepID=A0A1I8H9N5_9PLAT
MFFASSAVVLAEVVKFAISCCLLAKQCGSWQAFSRLVWLGTVGDPLDCLKISVPAVVYVLQNNLLYVAIENLDPVTYQVTYQLKLLTTALFSVAMLKRRLTPRQWLSLVALAAGVALVQCQSIGADDGAGTKGAIVQRPWLGLTAVLAASLMSGFAGVYFEFVLKSTGKSLWWRNTQLSVEGVLLGLITALLGDGSRMLQLGFLHGYDKWVVAMVVQYTDNIVKGFAASAAILLACLVSVLAFDLRLGWELLVGGGLVVGAIFGYATGGGR